MGLVRYIPENWILTTQREKLGFSQEDIAKKAGIKLEQYQNFENGKRSIYSSSFSHTHVTNTKKRR